ncbi:MAG TPA: hypothetical protein VFQ70_04315 [Candidatus Saccharimonadaceae bacterium]|nr:hypothetical protein [Candidatus Saccharimonadaceae bacterium]
MRYTRQNRLVGEHGFTLVEMLVIAPIALLIIAGFIALMVNMTGDVLATQQRSGQIYNTEDALDEIQHDVRLSSGFASSVAATSPQGANNDASTWTATAGGKTLLISTFGTTNTSNVSNSLVYQSTPNSCSSGSYIYNPPYIVYIVYFIAPSSDGSSNALWRRTILSPGTTCSNGTLVQRASCAYGATINGSPCQTHDEEVLDGVTNASFTYYVNPGDTTPVSDPTTAGTVDASLTTTSNVAGKTFTYTADLRGTSIN